MRVERSQPQVVQQEDNTYKMQNKNAGSCTDRTTDAFTLSLKTKLLSASCHIASYVIRAMCSMHILHMAVQYAATHSNLVGISCKPE